jgi:CubicO group peptidase (beta-lactamase class C family)
MIKKILKVFGYLIVLLLAIANIYIIVSGRTYLYKGIYNTYLKGRKGPSINEYQIFDNRKVLAGNPKPWPLHENFGKVKPDAYLKHYLDSLETIGYVVIKDGKLLYEYYNDGFSDTSHTNSFSMAKTYLSAMIGIAIAEGKIDSLNVPLSKYIPEYGTDDRKKITLKHAVTMCTGMDFQESYSSPFTYPAEAYYGKELKALTLKYKPKKEPGTYFDYQSGNTTLVGMVLEKATGKTISDYLSEKLWTPMNCEQSALWNLDHENGFEKAFCCLQSNARDFARIGQLYLDSGRWNGQQLIPKDYVINSTKSFADLPEEGEPQSFPFYGYAWWLMKYNDKIIPYAQGILGQYIFIVPEHNLVVCRLGSKKGKHSKKGYWYKLNEVCIDMAVGLK